MEQIQEIRKTASCDHLICNKGGTGNAVEKGCLFNKKCWFNLIFIGKKMHLDPILKPFPKIVPAAL